MSDCLRLSTADNTRYSENFSMVLESLGMDKPSLDGLR